MKKGSLFLFISLGMLFSSFSYVQNQSIQVYAVDEHITDMSAVALESGESIDSSNIFYDDFSSNRLDSNWVVSNRKWGTFENYGVAADNVYLNSTKKKLVIRALGNQHLETSRIDEIGGSLSGGAIVLKQTARPGRYEVKMKAAYKVGVCSAFWTYTEDGSANNHEIDIELPPKSVDEDGNNVFNEVLFTNYIGISNYEQKTKKLNYFVNDGEYHTFAFDWYYSSNHKMVNYYIDGVLAATNSDVSKVPYLPTRLWLGAWIPNNPDFVGAPNFDKCYMEIDYVKYSPFTNQLPQTSGEAGGCGATSTDYHVTSDELRYDYLSNGEFNAIAKNSSLSIRGYEVNGTAKLDNGYDHNDSPTSGGAKINSGSSIAYKVDSVSKNQKFNLSTYYKGTGNVLISFFNRSNNLISNLGVDLTQSASWTNKEYDFTVPENTFYLKVKVNATEDLFIDDLFMVLNNSGGGEENPPSGGDDPTPTPPPTPSGGESVVLAPAIYVVLGAVPTAVVFSVILIIVIFAKKKQ